MNKSTPIEDEGSFTGHHQTDSAACVADVQRLKIRVQYQNWFQHNYTLTLRIIARVFHQINSTGS
jgi:hypothetical protein